MIFADYYSMVKNTGIDTKIIEYRLDNVLVSSCITDFLDNALSMVYSFYSPYANKYSLGKYMILDHIKFGKKYDKDIDKRKKGIFVSTILVLLRWLWSVIPIYSALSGATVALLLPF